MTLTHRGRRIVVMIGCALGWSVADPATGQVTIVAEPSAWTATMDPVAPTTGTGRCTLFVTRSGHRAVVRCALNGVAPTAVAFFVDRFGISHQAVASLATTGGSAASATIDHPPASLVDALSAGVARVELHDATGLLMRGVLGPGPATWTRVGLDGTGVVPRSESAASGTCDILVTETPALVGIDCALTGTSGDTITVHAGAAGQTGDPLGTFSIPRNDARPTVWTDAGGALTQTARGDAPYYIEIGAGLDAIRGQADGCRRDEQTLCLLDRFEVSAEGELGTDSTRVTGEAEPISAHFGLLRMRGTDASGIAINTLSGVTAYVKNSCNALPAFTVQLTINAGTTSVQVRDTKTAISRTFTLDADTLSLLDQTTFTCS